MQYYFYSQDIVKMPSNLIANLTAKLIAARYWSAHTEYWQQYLNEFQCWW